MCFRSRRPALSLPRLARYEQVYLTCKVPLALINGSFFFFFTSLLLSAPPQPVYIPSYFITINPTQHINRARAPAIGVTQQCSLQESCFFFKRFHGRPSCRAVGTLSLPTITVAQCVPVTIVVVRLFPVQCARVTRMCSVSFVHRSSTCSYSCRPCLPVMCIA